MKALRVIVMALLVGTAAYAGTLPPVQTVFVILLENHVWADFKDRTNAPFINDTLLPMAAHCEQYFNPPHLHPSEPNYLWLEAGTNFGIFDDNDPAVNHQNTTNHLAAQLYAADISWKAYQEDITGDVVPLTSINGYTPRHNPFVYFDDVTGTNNPYDPSGLAHIRPYAELAGDLTNNAVARYNFITPNLCDDGHDSCAPQYDSVRQTDDWLAGAVPKILNSAAYRNNGALFITWDEGEGGSDGPIGMMLLSPLARGGGYCNAIRYTHSSFVRTMQEIFGVSPWLGDAANATNLSDLFRPMTPPTASHVIHISVDGLRPDAVTALGPTNVPHFYRLRTQGAFTDNARSDFDYTVTLPNHTSQLTGRSVTGPAGHGWTDNSDPAPGQTLASNKGSYVAGGFDVAHDRGLKTGLFASKSKFLLYATSWDATNGEPDVFGPDNGRNKIDVYVNNGDTVALVDAMITSLTNQPLNYVFLHLADPDLTGHGYGWDVTPGSFYSEAIKKMDARLGTIFDLVDDDARFTGSTAIILTADHGGSDYNHADATLRENFTIPFYVWGPGVMAGANLYALNWTNRLDPGTNRPDYYAPVQPIRNGEAANVALKLLGLEAVPGSTLDAAEDLALTLPPPKNLSVIRADTNVVLSFETISNVLYDIQACSDLRPDSWSNLATNVAGTGGTVTNVDQAAPDFYARFYRLRLHF